MLNWLEICTPKFGKLPGIFVIRVLSEVVGIYDGSKRQETDPNPDLTKVEDLTNRVCKQAESGIPEPPKYVESWPFGLHVGFLGHCFTCLGGRGGVR